MRWYLSQLILKHAVKNIYQPNFYLFNIFSYTYEALIFGRQRYMWRRIYLGHSTTCLSSITSNHVFYMKLSVFRNALSFYFNRFLFSLVFCFWKVAEFQVNESQSNIKVNPNRRLCGNASPVGFCSVYSVFFFLFIYLQILLFTYQLLLFCL